MVKKKKKRKEKHSLPTVFTQFRMQVKIFYEKYGLGRPRLKLGRVSFYGGHQIPCIRDSHEMCSDFKESVVWTAANS